MKKPELTADRLRQLLDYSPETGLFVWRKSRGTAKAGNIAGTVGNKGYIHIVVDGKRYSAHRLAFLYMTGEFPLNEVDHADMNPSNNRWSNLRDAYRTQNNFNRKKQPNNKTGYPGVYFHKQSGKFRSVMSLFGKEYYFGGFDTAHDAHLARDGAARLIQGDFYQGSIPNE